MPMKDNRKYRSKGHRPPCFYLCRRRKSSSFLFTSTNLSPPLPQGRC